MGAAGGNTDTLLHYIIIETPGKHVSNRMTDIFAMYDTPTAFYIDFSLLLPNCQPITT